VQLERRTPSGVIFLGRLPHSELDCVGGTAWIQVVPSLGFEPFGLVSAEAMMRGRAVVASRTGGLQEQVEPGVTGTLVEAGNRDALAAALTALLSSRSMCERMGECARRVAEERFAADIYVDRVLALYETVIADNRRALHGIKTVDRHLTRHIVASAE
jgi:glycosyltransferase involved in cell wall biosynthesis